MRNSEKDKLIEDGIKYAHGIDGSGPDYQKAYECYKSVLVSDANYPRALKFLIGACEDMFNFDEAVKYSRHLCSVLPKDADASYALAHVYGTVGMHDKATAELERTMKLDPNKGSAYYRYVASRKFKESPKLLDIARRRVKDSTGENRYWFAFTAAKILDDLKQYDDAWKYYTIGNDASERDWMPEKWARKLSQTAEIEICDGVHPSPNPIFVVGMPRSGTSLVERIIDCHPQAVGRGERFCMKWMEETLHLHATSPWPYCLPQVKDRDIQKYGDIYLKNSFTNLKTVDKHPINFTRLGLIRRVFPNARIIHTIRNPLDTCLSCYFQPMGKMHWTFDLYHIALYYKAYIKMMDHWENKIDMTHVHYEMLIENRDTITRELIKGCGLDWDDKCMAPHKSKGAVVTASHEQCRRPVYKTSVRRFENYEHHLGPLKEYLG